MKKLKYIFLLSFVAFLAVSCYKDKGNYDYVSISDIIIEGIDSSYSTISGIDTLKIMPEITTSYNENELEYTWLIYEDLEGTPDTLGYEKNLAYFINESVGSYTLLYIVENQTNGYSQHATTTLEVSTLYSKGHYILKESIDGNTDMDLLLDDGQMIRDLILNTQGATLSGAPRSMGLLYDQPMIDPVSMDKINVHSVGVITSDGKVNIFRGDNLDLIFDHSTMFYDAPNDVPYKFFTAYTVAGYLSSNGLYENSLQLKGPSTGVFGFPDSGELSGGSDHYAFPTAGLGILYWDETHRRLIRTNYYGTVSLVSDDNYPTADLNYDCLFMGNYWGNAYALFKDKTDPSRLVLYSIFIKDLYSSPVVTDAREISASSKMHNATLFASNERTTQLIYFVADNKLYYYDVANDAEYEMSATGLPVDETITYVSNRFDFNATSPFNYLTIATYKNGNYKIYMYNMVGGLPYGEPERIASGEGKVKETHYLKSVWDYNFDAAAAFGYLYGYSK